MIFNVADSKLLCALPFIIFLKVDGGIPPERSRIRQTLACIVAQLSHALVASHIVMTDPLPPFS